MGATDEHRQTRILQNKAVCKRTRDISVSALFLGERHPSGAEADMFRARLPVFICVLKNTLPYL
jgi:hypothetical protein